MSKTAILFDVDNTLLDNDAIKAGFGDKIDAALGAGTSKTYWATYETLRKELGFADYLATVQRCWVDSGRDPRWLPAAGFMLDCGFGDYMYPNVQATLAHAATLGTPWIVTDGDAVFQPHKLRHSGLWDAFAGKVLVYRHKQNELADIARRTGAERFVMVDDKPHLLSAMKQGWGARATTVWVRQGHYANPAPAHVDADITIDHISDFAGLSAARLSAVSAR